MSIVLGISGFPLFCREFPHIPLIRSEREKCREIAEALIFYVLQVDRPAGMPEDAGVTPQSLVNEPSPNLLRQGSRGDNSRISIALGGREAAFVADRRVKLEQLTLTTPEQIYHRSTSLLAKAFLRLFPRASIFSLNAVEYKIKDEKMKQNSSERNIQ
jgi:hypothetical protein